MNNKNFLYIGIGAVLIIFIIVIFSFIYYQKINLINSISWERKLVQKELSNCEKKLADTLSSTTIYGKTKCPEAIVSGLDYYEIYSSTSTKDWFVYKNNDLNFSFNFPKDWIFRSLGDSGFTGHGKIGDIEIFDPEKLITFTLSINPGGTGYFSLKNYQLIKINNKWQIGEKSLSTGGEGFTAEDVLEDIEKSEFMTIGLNGGYDESKNIFILYNYDRKYEADAEKMLEKLVGSILF